jgi:hypothetical protein
MRNLPTITLYSSLIAAGLPDGGYFVETPLMTGKFFLEIKFLISAIEKRFFLRSSCQALAFGIRIQI